jgi:hypothetical protein
MQATTTPKLADHRSATQAVLAVVFLTVALVVGGTIGIAIQQASAPAAPAALVGDYEASGLRNGPIQSGDSRGLYGAPGAFRIPAAPAGSAADDQMSKFNSWGLSKPGADEAEKVGRAHR